MCRCCDEECLCFQIIERHLWQRWPPAPLTDEEERHETILISGIKEKQVSLFTAAACCVCYSMFFSAYCVASFRTTHAELCNCLLSTCISRPKLSEGNWTNKLPGGGKEKQQKQEQQQLRRMLRVASLALQRSARRFCSRPRDSRICLLALAVIPGLPQASSASVCVEEIKNHEHMARRLEV